ncbi:NUDIX hydrolase [Lichenifustis flavocetrariae]|uniref:NUDIX hydrolase n=1 Tax=Lichenifustis flavocetrariae TaxID=2949735 RepID=A0AA42CLR3_9HYPH|nr:NUDIX hydrolase [Lichenifustis flavocetrariae]MCW6507652.1 NUDIX hydrolase [Lichenifustis flavocetrariae]
MNRPHRPGQIEQVRQQYGALPFRRIDGIEIMLITSRETRRWVIPKGWPMKGRRPRGTAAGEAMEEAGISGHIAKTPIGSYTYIKRGIGGQRWPCKVDVFPLEVRVERRTWREREQRARQWFSYVEAAEVVTEPELRALILGFGVAFDR